MTYLLIHYEVLNMVTYYNEEHVEVTEKKVQLDFMPLLLFTSLLCSSDVVAAVSIVNYNDQPKLYSCIFGEGVVNDIVSIILFNTVKGLQGSQFYWYTVFIVMA
jgi:NhaP-type Na+/H+ or K+/H+ antiporter